MLYFLQGKWPISVLLIRLFMLSANLVGIEVLNYHARNVVKHDLVACSECKTTYSMHKNGSEVLSLEKYY